MRIKKCYGIKLIKKELKGCYQFFLKEANLEQTSAGYGLIHDKSGKDFEIASIASVGYGLAAYIVGVEHRWISFEEAYRRVNKTLETVLTTLEHEQGFFYHFVNSKTGKREWNCEISIIDTAILICGAITAGEYFKGSIRKKAEELYRNKQTNQFYMGYTPEKGFFGHWDQYAEQLMVYVLGVASPTHSVSSSMYRELRKEKMDYGTIKDIIYTYCGTLFTYQFSHAWIPFMNTQDEEGIDWFENSIKATKANRQYCIDQQEKFHTYGENSWGLTSCMGPSGYKEYGAQPCKAELTKENDGTVTPCGAIGSIVFTPKQSMQAMEYYYNMFPKLWGKYGFKDGYCLDTKKPWFSDIYIGIDKGISLVMIENYLSGTIWNYFSQNTYVKRGLERLGIRAKTRQKKEKQEIK